MEREGCIYGSQSRPQELVPGYVETVTSLNFTHSLVTRRTQLTRHTFDKYKHTFTENNLRILTHQTILITET